MREGRVVVLGSLAFLAGRTFTLAGTPVLLGGDQGFFWMYGQRMLRGELPYRDFFQFTPPGADLAHALAFGVLGARIWVTSLLVLLLGLALAVVVRRVARGIMPGKDADLSALFFVVLVVGQALTTTHHSWSSLLVLLAVSVMDDGRRLSRVAGAGALLGLATFCTQSHGAAALAGFLVFLVSERGLATRLLALLAAYGATVAVSLSYFVARVGLAPVWSCLVSYVAHLGASPRASLALPEAMTWRSAPAMLPFVLVYVAVLAGLVVTPLRLRRSDGQPAEVAARTKLLWLVGVCLLLPVLTSPSWVRVFAVAAPGVILVVAALRGGSRWGALVRPLARVGVVGLALLLVRSTQRHHDRIVALPGGAAATDAATADELLSLTHRNAPGTLFFAADRPSLYLPLAVRSPLYLDAAVPSSQTTLENARRAVADLARLPMRDVLWSTVLEDAMPGDEDCGMAVLRRYLHERFHLVRRYAGGDELWERKD